MINIAEMKRRGIRPRVHGNGFIQVDLTESTRLHVWGDKRIPRQNTYTPIHDHVFGFKSTIIVGRLFNIVYDYKRQPFGDYRVYVPEIREGEDTILKTTTERVRIFPIRADLVDWQTADKTYEMDPFTLHETFVTEPTATIIQKSDLTMAQGNPFKPRVLVKWGQEPDNDFNRYAYDDELLWRIVERVLKRRHK